MFKINKIDCTIKPKKFESLNNGVWYYNFNIEEEPWEDSIRYKYSLVRINGTPTLGKCYLALLEAYVNEEGTCLAQYNPSKTKQDEELLKSLYNLVEIDFGLKEKPSELEIEKEKVIKAISDYDVSAEVNSFFLNDLQVWLDKSTRVGLMNSLNIEKANGKEISTLWFGNIKLSINTDTAIQMLSLLELYALECYNKTAEHKVNILNFTSIKEVTEYDYTKGYPKKLNFTV